MATFIIADLHLGANKQMLLSAFKSFYGRLLLNDKVIILGDLFDVFVGLDRTDKFYKQVRDIIWQANAKGVTTFFQRGNRDFLINKADAAYFGFKLLPDYYVVQTPRGPALIMHGDQLCVNDRAFQRFRRLTKNGLVRFLFLKLPMSVRKKIGTRIRKTSQQQNPFRNNSPASYGLVRHAGVHCLKMSRCKILIHGHFHVFGAQRDAFGAGTYRFGLGAWANNFSYIHIDRHKFDIIQKPLERLF